MNPTRPLAVGCVVVGRGAALEPKTIPPGAPGTVLTTPSGGGEPVFASTATTVQAVPAVFVRVHNSTSQAIADNTETALTCNTEQFDTDAMHSTSSNTSRLTCTVAGVYLIGGVVVWAVATAATSHRFMGIRLNGSARLASTYISIAASTPSFLTVTTAYPLSVGDYVEMTAYTLNDGTQNATASPFWALRVGA